MTDYWVSSKKHYCEVCKCWVSGHSQNVKKHESSARHLSSMRHKMIESHKKKVEKKKQEQFEAEEMKRLNSITLENPVPTESSTSMPLMSSMFSYTPLAQAPVDMESEKRRIMNTIQRSLAGIETPEHVEVKNVTKWTATIDQEDGTLVYYNRVTGVRTKNKPKDFDGVIPSSSAHLTSNWVLKYDPNKRLRYYHNVDTGEVRWLDEKPIAVEVPETQEVDNSKLLVTQTPTVERKPDIKIKFKREEEPPDKESNEFNTSTSKNEKIKSEDSKDGKDTKVKEETSSKDDEKELKERMAPVIGQWEVVNPKDSVFSDWVDDPSKFTNAEEEKKEKDSRPSTTLKAEKRLLRDLDDPAEVPKPVYKKTNEEGKGDREEQPVVFKKRKIPKRD